ncbi:DUF5076 domain-containing protein [Aeoliella mucimassa]|uniref:DUF5076 domain-containing protein n=1 Tax=Aeoliella mucimassa TaxID=2527972 RepID=A0A518AWJ8_9BACT|nr:DUF5076 domain-containing protein [Aeoliella mucimassa]QDU59112.1 hypothetical protein Pan181_53530 [Aeoliella mucimassa]
MKPLEIPPAALADDQAVEIARIWGAGGKQHVTLASGIWKDPGNWGIMLVDLATHIANAYEQNSLCTKRQCLDRIKDVFDSEWQEPTDDPTGEIVN